MLLNSPDSIKKDQLHRITFERCLERTEGNEQRLHPSHAWKSYKFNIDHYQIEPKDLCTWNRHDDRPKTILKNLCSTVTKKTQRCNLELYDRLDIKIDKNVQEGFFVFLKMLQTMKNLRALTLEFVGPQNSLSIKQLEALVMCISRHLFKLKELILNFKLQWRDFRGGNEKHLNILVNQLFKGLPHLEKLIINSGQEISFESFKFLSRRITGCIPNLKTLSANFQNSDALIDRSLTTIVNHTSHNIKNLLNLKLSFNDSHKFSYRGFWIFSKLLGKQLSHLHSLSLNFDRCESFESKALNVLSFEIFTKLTDLQTLELSFPGSCLKIKKVGFENFVRNMAHNKNQLKNFKVDFSRRDLRSDEEFEIIVEGISQHLSNLKGLSLCFKQSTITNQGLDAIEGHIAKLTNLTKLTFDFTDNRYFHMKYITQLAKAIAKNLKKLTELHLMFHALDYVDYGIKNTDRSDIEAIFAENGLAHLELGIKGGKSRYILY